MDTLHAQGIALVGSLQIAELIAEYGLQHEEYETRIQREKDKTQRDAEFGTARVPLWKRAPH